MRLGRADPWLASLPLKGQTSQPVRSPLVLLGGSPSVQVEDKTPGQVCGQELRETRVLGSSFRNLIPAGQLICSLSFPSGKENLQPASPVLLPGVTREWGLAPVPSQEQRQLTWGVEEALSGSSLRS